MRIVKPAEGRKSEKTDVAERADREQRDGWKIWDGKELYLRMSPA